MARLTASLGLPFPRAPLHLLPPHLQAQQHALHTQRGLTGAPALTEHRVTGRDSGRQHLPSPNARQGQDLTMDQLLSPGGEPASSAVCWELSSFLLLEPRPEPRRSSRHDNPRGHPLKPAPPAAAPLSGLRSSVASVLSGQRTNILREGNGQLLPNLEGEFEGRSILPGADRQSLGKQRTSQMF